MIEQVHVEVGWKKLLAFKVDILLKGGTQSWTGDLLICSQMLYHWAIPPLDDSYQHVCVSNTLSIDYVAMKT